MRSQRKEWKVTQRGMDGVGSDMAVATRGRRRIAKIWRGSQRRLVGQLGRACWMSVSASLAWFGPGTTWSSSNLSDQVLMSSSLGWVSGCNDKNCCGMWAVERRVKEARTGERSRLPVNAVTPAFVAAG